MVRPAPQPSCAHPSTRRRFAGVAYKAGAAGAAGAAKADTGVGATGGSEQPDIGIYCIYKWKALQHFPEDVLLFALCKFTKKRQGGDAKYDAAR